MKRWVVSDWHLGETPERLRTLQRPFATTQEHIDVLVSLHNSLVAPDDEVIVAGDVCYQKRPEFLDQVSRFNGRKTLIRGNHDEVISDGDFLKFFDIVVGHGCGIEMDLGFPAYVTHYPTRARPDRFNLVGHVHAAWKVQLNMVNIGVDANHFRPHDLSNMRFFFQAITDFYDDDVWIAYDPINVDYASKRGKPGSYFKEEKK